MNKICVVYEKNKIQVKVEETFESFKYTLKNELNITDFEFENLDLCYGGQNQENAIIQSQDDYKKALDVIKSSKRILSLKKREKRNTDLNKTIIFEINPVFIEENSIITSFSNLKIDYIFSNQKSINPSTLLKRIQKINRLKITFVSNIEILPSINTRERIIKTQVVLGTKTCQCNFPITSEFFICKDCEYRVLCPIGGKNHHHQIKKFSFDYAEKSKLVLNKISSLGWDKDEVKNKIEKNKANYSKTIRDLLTCLSKY